MPQGAIVTRGRQTVIGPASAHPSWRERADGLNPTKGTGFELPAELKLDQQAGRDKTSQPAGGPQGTVMVAEALDHADWLTAVFARTT